MFAVYYPGTNLQNTVDYLFKKFFYQLNVTLSGSVLPLICLCSAQKRVRFYMIEYFNRPPHWLTHDVCTKPNNKIYLSSSWRPFLFQRQIRHVGFYALVVQIFAHHEKIAETGPSHGRRCDPVWGEYGACSRRD